ncbi:hypothetical protein [Rhodococcus qingshengii]|uniref:hypothetical protein n=1 Tax=Rhodococcus qingshengii TaxID=334542 RepID=UPI001BE9D9D8|nr:hypothetical protein [Rhodococcus qingshengii]MBT2275872.1 hypothetical protein [Rhodococcus qingshengii]
MPTARTVRRVVGGVLFAGVVATGAVGLGLAIAGAAHASPAEDCAAVRARDHQVYLNLIDSLPPGSPIPPEYVNPCLTATPTTTATAVPTATVGLPGAQAPGGGPNVGANAPTNFPAYRGTPIVTLAPSAQPATARTPDSQAQARQGSTDTEIGSAATQPDGSRSAETGVGAGQPTAARTPGAASVVDPDPGSSAIAASTSSTAGSGGPGQVGYAALALIGAAGVTAGGASLRRRQRSEAANKLAASSVPVQRGTTLLKDTPVSGEVPQYTPVPSTEPMPTAPPGYYYLAQCTPDYPEGAWIMCPEGDNPTR